jgi:hypothetical protein
MVQVVMVQLHCFKIQVVKPQHIMLLNKMERLYKWLAKLIQHGILVYSNLISEQHDLIRGKLKSKQNTNLISFIETNPNLFYFEFLLFVR